MPKRRQAVMVRWQRTCLSSGVGQIGVWEWGNQHRPLDNPPFPRHILLLYKWSNASNRRIDDGEKGTGSKTRAVLDYIKAHPGVGNTEIAAALTKAGVSITPSHVSTIKNLNKEAVAKAAGTATTSQEPVNKSKAIRDYLKLIPVPPTRRLLRS